MSKCPTPRSKAGRVPFYATRVRAEGKGPAAGRAGHPCHGGHDSLAGAEGKGPPPPPAAPALWHTRRPRRVRQPVAGASGIVNRCRCREPLPPCQKAQWMLFFAGNGPCPRSRGLWRERRRSVRTAGNPMLGAQVPRSATRRAEPATRRDHTNMSMLLWPRMSDSSDIFTPRRLTGGASPSRSAAWRSRSAARSISA